MAARTAAAQSLDTALNQFLSDLDVYLALGQPAEPANAVADYAWRVLISRLASRDRMKPILFRNPRGEPVAYAIAAAAGTHDVETLDPNA
jgi:hypothetical protein